MGATRHQVRDKLVTTFTDAPFNQVYGYVPQNLQGTKILCITTSKTKYTVETGSNKHAEHEFVFEVYVSRDAVTVEDDLDACAEAIRAGFVTCASDTTWDFVGDATSEAGYPLMPGMPYRIERFKATVKVRRNT